MYLSLSIYIYIHMYMHMFMYMYVSLSLSIYIYTYICVYIYVDIHIIYIYIYICIRLSRRRIFTTVYREQKGGAGARRAPGAASLFLVLLCLSLLLCLCRLCYFFVVVVCCLFLCCLGAWRAVCFGARGWGASWRHAWYFSGGCLFWKYLFSILIKCPNTIASHNFTSHRIVQIYGIWNKHSFYILVHFLSHTPVSPSPPNDNVYKRVQVECTRPVK